MKTLEQEYKENTGFDAYAPNNMRPHIAEDVYVEWLEDIVENQRKENKDLLNWLKSELQEETHYKLGKTINNYRSYKILLLTKIINKIKI